jgi:hypothetical protein
MNYPTPGKTYRHYKGGLYQVLFLSSHTETKEVLVNYKSIHFGSYYSRPLDLWNELVSDETQPYLKIKRYEIEKEN